jgi:replication factor A1
MEIMKVSELQPGMRKVNVVVKVVEIGAIRNVTVKTDGKQHQVVDVTVGDETGIISMSVWDEMIHQIKQRDIIRIANGYVGEFGGKMQLNVGKFGKWERCESDEFDIEVPSGRDEIQTASSAGAGPATFIKTIEAPRKKAGINLIVKVEGQLPARKAMTKDGISHDINRFLVGDETASINFVLWDKGEDIGAGDVLEIRGGYIREFSKILELNLSKTGSYAKSDAEILDINTERNISRPP